MDRSVEITLGRKHCRLCYSILALFDTAERYGSVQRALELLQSDGPDALEAVRWFAVRLSREGAACARLLGEEAPDSLSGEDVPDVISPWEFVRLREAVAEAIGLGYQREVPEREGRERDLGLEELTEKKERAGASGQNTTTSR